MSVDRITRVNELLRREISSLLFRIINEGDCDLSAITITRVETSRNLRHAKVFVSIRDHSNERNKMLSQLGKHAPEIQRLINKNVNLKYTPRLNFELDTSIEEGDRILRLLYEITPDDDEEDSI